MRTHAVSRGMTLLISIAVAAMSFNVAHAKNIKKQNLLELLTHTESIVVGTVSAKSDGIQNGLPYTEILSRCLLQQPYCLSAQTTQPLLIFRLRLEFIFRPRKTTVQL